MCHTKLEKPPKTFSVSFVVGVKKMPQVQSQVWMAWKLTQIP